MLISRQVTTAEDIPIGIRVLEGVVDPDGDPLRVTGATAEDHAVLVIDRSIVRVTPRRDFFGEIDITYQVSDGSRTLTGLAVLTVNPVNDAPVAVSATMTTRRGAPVLLAGTDVDQDALTYEIDAAPAHGTLTGTAPSLQYTPVAGFVGDDVITYRVRDGRAASEPATVQIRVVAGSPPFAISDQVFAAEDVALDIVLRADELDGDPLTFTIVTPPAHGELLGTPPNLVYKPAKDFSGSDALTFSVDDGDGPTNVATKSITVSPVNDAPVATPQTVAATEDVNQTITLQGSDVDGSTPFFVVQTNPLHGTLTGTGATRTYRPHANYHGPDSFTFTATDFVSGSAPATVTITVASVEDPPVAQPVSLNVAEDNAATVQLLGSDGDGDPVTIAITSAPANGTLTGTPPTLTYRPAAEFSGPDSFTYTATSGGETSAAATVTLQVEARNDDPVASDGSVVTAEDTPIAIVLQATDVDNPTLIFAPLTLPADGTLSGTGPNLTYTPASNTSGTRSFTFRARDGLGGFDDATVTIQITPVNDPPTTADDFVLTEPGAPITFAVIDNDGDVEGDAVQLDSVAAPAHGSVEIVDSKLVYTPEAGFTGVEIFAYTAVDAHGAPSTGRAHVGVGTFPPGAPTEVLTTVGTPISPATSSIAPALSADGRYLALVSTLPLVSDDTNGFSDIFLFDRGTHALTRISVATGGGQANEASFRPHVSADGRYVVFDSQASNLVAGDTNGAFDVFRHDRVTGETIRISVATGGAQASGVSLDAEISDDGNLVVFSSSAFDLIALDNNGEVDIFVRNVLAGTTVRASVTATGGEADLAASAPTISGDGRHVAFASTATNLVAGDLNNVSDVFVRDLVSGTTTRVSVSSIGGEANAACTQPSLSRTGGFISFRSAANNLIGGPPLTPQRARLYVRDAQQQTTTLAVALSSDVISGRLSGDGRYLTAFTSSGLVIRDRFAGVTSTPPGASTWMWPMLSGNGRYVVALDTTGGGRAIVTPNPL